MKGILRHGRYWLAMLLLLLIAGGLLLWQRQTRPARLLTSAEAALATEHWSEAEPRIAFFLQHDPSNARGHLLHARLLRKKNLAAEAEAALRQALKLGLPEAEGRREFALLQSLRRLTPATEQSLLEALKSNPDDVEVLAALAQGYLREQRAREAEPLYTRLLQLQPHRLEHLLGRGQARLASAHEPGGRLGDAVADFEEVLERQPNHFEARLFLGQAYLADARLAEAKPHFQACRDLQPGRPEPWVGLAHCAIEASVEQAAKLADEALQRDADFLPALVLRGDLHLRQQRPADAVPLYRRALRHDARNAGLHLKLAQALHATGNADEARQHEQAYRELLEAKR